MTLSSPSLSPDELSRRDALAGRLFEAMNGAFLLATVHLGGELGLYRALADAGLSTAPELAARAGVDGRYVREWLEQQVVTGILVVDDPAAAPEARRFSLPPGHGEALLEPDSPESAMAMPLFAASGMRMVPRLVEVFRDGRGIDWGEYPSAVAAQELANRPLFRHQLTQELLPAVPDIEARLKQGIRVADVATGAGWAAIAMAQAYPASTIDGVDVDPESIERARRNAADEGIGEDRVRFHLVDAASHDLDGRFDLVTVFEAVHDLAHPVEVLRSIRALLSPGGSVIVADERVGETFLGPDTDLDGIMYGYSVIFCLPAGRPDPSAAATGTVMRPDTMRRYALDAGFSEVTILPIEHEAFRFYRLAP